MLLFQCYIIVRIIIEIDSCICPCICRSCTCQLENQCQAGSVCSLRQCFYTLTGAISGAAESSSASKETDLADVINAITKLQRKVERFEDAFGDMTIELTAGDLTIGKACVRDCNIMAKRSGKSPFNF